MMSSMTAILSLLAAVISQSADAVEFEKLQLTDKYYCDGIHFGDINRDGKADVVAGPFWYAGPKFDKATAFYEPVAMDPASNPSNSMYSFVRDFNGDGWPDILVLGRVKHHEAFWYENPRGKEGLWAKHFVFERIRGESPTLCDIDRDGKPELICHWDNQWGLLQPDPTAAEKPWKFRPIMPAGEWQEYYHGTGVGDVNGDGRDDLILNDGWWEQPPRGSEQTFWTEHRFLFSADRGGAQMFAYDVDGDGRNDVITSLNAHGWGLAWFRQVRREGQITFEKQLIMGDRSELKKYGVAFTQPHALDLADVDGDGLKDILVGKRLWAHGPTGDIEPNEDPVVYWFQLKREGKGEARFVPHLIDDQSGVGVQVVGADVNGDRLTDVLTVSKRGTFVFLQKRRGGR